MGDAADLVSATHELEEANMEGAADESRFVTVAVVTSQFSGNGHGCVNGRSVASGSQGSRSGKHLKRRLTMEACKWRFAPEARNGGLQWRGGMSGKGCWQLTPPLEVCSQPEMMVA